MDLFLYVPSEANSDTGTTSARPVKRWTLVETCQLQFTIPPSGFLPKELTNSDQNCTLTLPEVARTRWSDNDSSTKGGPLRAMLCFRRVEGESVGPILAEVPFTLTRIATGVWSSGTGANKERKLLEPEESKGRDAHLMMDTATHVPHFRYGSQPVLLRFVADLASYGGPPPYYRGDGTPMVALPWNRSAYRPVFYVDDNALQHSAQREVAPPSEAVNRPPLALRIQISTLSPIRDVVNKQISMALSAAESLLHGSELDEFRFWLRDERLYRFLLTQVISFVHIWLDYLAFRDEVRFYRGKSDLGGVSISSIVTRLICSVIIFLYLMDGGGTSWIILLGVFSDVAIAAWKAWRVLRPTRTQTFPYFKFHSTQTPAERKTAQYDRIAITHLMLFLAPVMMGWALYALQRYAYASWYSWFISNMANCVYSVGFISLCPQLYINFRLKSVAHLPWKVFLYKVFNTFVDDVFAFLIDMPWKHRIMTLRDDVVFGLFLVQAWMYRVDKARTNEYGYSYDTPQSPKKDKLQ